MPRTEEEFDKLGLDLPKPPYLENILRSVADAPPITPERLKRVKDIVASASTAPVATDAPHRD